MQEVQLSANGPILTARLHPLCATLQGMSDAGGSKRTPVLGAGTSAECTCGQSKLSLVRSFGMGVRVGGSSRGERDSTGEKLEKGMLLVLNREKETCDKECK